MHAPRGAPVRFSVGPVETPDVPVQFAIKRIIDVTAAATALFILLPAMVAIGMVIKADSKGPVLRRELRIGRDTVPYESLTFRCVHQDRGGKMEHAAPLTRTGRFLRKMQMEALPQFWNVMRGDMSLVGPQAHVPDMMASGLAFEEIVRGYHRRHVVKPGMTGLARVRHMTAPVEKRWPAIRGIVHDVDYIRNFSLLLDLKILKQTASIAWRHAFA
ncbi:sugar transferase [Pararhizobium gei]|uniref:sugar transferase n=1 Tax=Pararhizobium gei TaxID=1395951 RepID=UPI0023D9CD07|nr:sugar transferase [Rhizobium gei]